MPKPVYMICAQSMTQDKDTSLVSFFTVIERVTMILRPTGQSAPPPIPYDDLTRDVTTFKVMATWIREQDDNGEFEHEFSVVADGEEKSHGCRPFVFNEEKFIQRFVLVVHGLPVPAKAGIVLIKSKVRRHGSEDWLFQEYPIIVDLSQAPAVTPTAVTASDTT
jgi:hypothetical protein